MDILTWLLENSETLSVAAGALVAAASAITRLTPTKSDDKVVAAVQELLGRLSFLNPSGAAHALKLPGASADRSKQETPS